MTSPLFPPQMTDSHSNGLSVHSEDSPETVARLALQRPAHRLVFIHSGPFHQGRTVSQLRSNRPVQGSTPSSLSAEPLAQRGQL